LNTEPGASDVALVTVVVVFAADEDALLVPNGGTICATTLCGCGEISSAEKRENIIATAAAIDGFNTRDFLFFVLFKEVIDLITMFLY
jgi:hypothetical protein